MLRVKDSLTVFLIIISILHEIQEYTCFRIKNFDVPAVITSGSSTFLLCEFDLEKDKLVNLKWYFNDKEILRYEPKSIRDETQIFKPPFPKFNLEKTGVINSADRGSKVLLKNVNKEMSGKYKCEVTIESQFFTMNREGHMEVVPPVLTTTAHPSFHRAKQLDFGVEDEEEPQSNSIEVAGNGCSAITLNWFNIMNIMFILYRLIFVMH